MQDLRARLEELAGSRPLWKPLRPRVRKILIGVASLYALLTVAMLFVAYVWQPPEEQGYRSAYLAEAAPRYVETSVARFHYTMSGEGPPVVLLAGGQQWIFSYRDTIASLRAHFTVYAVDLPGQGYTTVRQSDFRYDFDAMASAIGSFLDAVDVSRASLIGHSWGGSWALYFAEQHPERVAKLVLIDSPALNVPSSWEWRVLDVPVAGEVIAKLMGKSDLERLLRKSFVHQERVTDEVVEENWAPLSRRENRKAMWMLKRRLEFSLTERKLQDLRVPTLVLWGGEDQFDDPRQAEELGRRIPGSIVRIVPSCGHSAHEDCPGSVNPELVSFLAKDH